MLSEKRPRLAHIVGIVVRKGGWLTMRPKEKRRAGDKLELLHTA